MAQAVLGRQVWAGKARLFGLAIGLCVAPVWAADQAQFAPLGYSPDARYFAFEQFGIQDGSGFPYADIFVIELGTDSWAPGTPVRTRIDDETGSLHAAREQAKAEAAELIERYDITRPAVYAAMRADGALDDEGLTIRYGVPGFGFDEPIGEHTLNLEIFKAPSSLDCMEWFGELPMGYGLIHQSDGVASHIHRDENVPASRNCVITYKVHSVLVPFEDYSHDNAVAVLSVWSFGFEGADRRFIALPVGR